MIKILLLLFLLFNFRTEAVPIDTPDIDERNEFVIKCPLGWGYRTFRGHNGLIGALWPAQTSFNLTDMAVFVFLHTTDEEIPGELDNINLFTEKCPLAEFKLAPLESANDMTLSISEEYFKGRCGRTMIFFKEIIDKYILIFACVSAKYISKKQFADIKGMVESYKAEVEKYIHLSAVQE